MTRPIGVVAPARPDRPREHGRLGPTALGLRDADPILVHVRPDTKRGTLSHG